MEDYVEILSDTSSSDKTIVVENEEIADILKKYSSGEHTLLPSTSKPIKATRNIYNLDEFSDGEFNYEPLENRLKGQNKKTCTPNARFSWQDKFSTNDFCEDSNDFDAVLNRISQLESEQFQNEPRQTYSKEMEALISGRIIENPKEKIQHSLNESSDEELSDVFNLQSELEKIKNNIKLDIKLSESEQFQNEPRQTYSKEMEALISGRIIENPKEKIQHSLNESSDEELSDVFNLQSDLEKIKNNIKLDIKLSEAEPVKTDNSSIDLSSEDLTAEPKSKRIKKKNSTDKESERLEKELAKVAKVKEKEQKKLEKENQKQLKNALKVVENCVKPTQCIQNLTVNIDDNILEKHYGDVIKAGLKSAGYNYNVSKQLVPNLISWTRKVPTMENMFLQNVQQQEKHYLLIMEVPEFIQHIVDNTLTGHMQSLMKMDQIGHLSLAILGLQRYYKYLKDGRNKECKTAASVTEFKDLPKVFKKDIDKSLVELQFFCKNIYIRPVEKFEDLAVFVGECTKSVALIPYKMTKGESLQQENEYFAVNNRDCIRVDKDGNGLSRLWNQFLRMFPLASLETAEAVTSVYPTIHSLMEAYKNCDTVQDGEKLLQNLPVRRAAGPLGGQRKLGPEFSKKAYRFFCATDNILL